MIRHYARVRFAALAPDAGELGVTPLAPGKLVHGAMQAIILLAGQDIRLSFKVHFNRVDLTDLLRQRGASSGEAAEQRATLLDFFREYVNLTAGGVNGELQRRAIDCGISLPVTTSGFDELFFSERLAPTCLTDGWTMQAPGLSFVCTSALDLASPAAFAAIAFGPADEVEAEHSVEFL